MSGFGLPFVKKFPEMKGKTYLQRLLVYVQLFFRFFFNNKKKIFRSLGQFSQSYPNSYYSTSWHKFFLPENIVV